VSPASLRPFGCQDAQWDRQLLGRVGLGSGAGRETQTHTCGDLGECQQAFDAVSMCPWHHIMMCTLIAMGSRYRQRVGVMSGAEHPSCCRQRALIVMPRLGWRRRGGSLEDGTGQVVCFVFRRQEREGGRAVAIFGRVRGAGLLPTCDKLSGRSGCGHRGLKCRAAVHYGTVPRWECLGALSRSRDWNVILSVAAVVPCAWLFPVEWLLFDVVSGLDEPPGRLNGAGGAGVSSVMPGRLERFKLIRGLGEFPQAWRRGTGGSHNRHRCNCL
jgi:hypothetical protein